MNNEWFYIYKWRVISSWELIYEIGKLIDYIVFVNVIFLENCNFLKGLVILDFLVCCDWCIGEKFWLRVYVFIIFGGWIMFKLVEFLGFWRFNVWEFWFVGFFVLSIVRICLGMLWYMRIGRLLFILLFCILSDFIGIFIDLDSGILGRVGEWVFEV